MPTLDTPPEGTLILELLFFVLVAHVFFWSVLTTRRRVGRIVRNIVLAAVVAGLWLYDFQASIDRFRDYSGILPAMTVFGFLAKQPYGPFLVWSFHVAFLAFLLVDSLRLMFGREVDQDA